MKSWDTICFLFMSLSYNVTIIGKIWITHVILLRLMVVLLATYSISADDRTLFICNAKQPGCTTRCYNIFAPVSLFLFWLVETISVLFPYAVFSVYVSHNVLRQVVNACALPNRQCKELNPLSGHSGTNISSQDASRRRFVCGPNEMDIPVFSIAYAVHILLRILIEVGFVVGGYSMFGFFIPKRYSCSSKDFQHFHQLSCDSPIDCFVSRSSEKSIMLVFMWILNGFSFLLSLMDLVFVIIVRNCRNRELLKRLEVDDE